MAIRSVRLDDETEATLRQIREATGWPISEVLKQGLRSLNSNSGTLRGSAPTTSTRASISALVDIQTHPRPKRGEA